MTLSMCDEGHEQIIWDGQSDCPLCRALRKYKGKMEVEGIARKALEIELAVIKKDREAVLQLLLVREASEKRPEPDV